MYAKCAIYRIRQIGSAIAARRLLHGGLGASSRRVIPIIIVDATFDRVRKVRISIEPRGRCPATER
jgi:hypothetical protein